MMSLGNKYSEIVKPALKAMQIFLTNAFANYVFVKQKHVYRAKL